MKSRAKKIVEKAFAEATALDRTQDKSPADLMKNEIKLIIQRMGVRDNADAIASAMMSVERGEHGYKIDRTMLRKILDDNNVPNIIPDTIRELERALSRSW